MDNLIWESTAKDTDITIRVPREFKELIFHIAARHQINVSKYLREKLYELAQTRPANANGQPPAA